MGVGGLEPRAAHLHPEGLGALAIGPLGHEDMEGLGGIDADVNRKRPGVGMLLIGGHRPAPRQEGRGATEVTAGRLSGVKRE